MTVPIGPALLYISGLEGDLDGKVTRVSIQRGTVIVARFEIDNGAFMQALRGRVTPIELIGRQEKK